MPILEGIRIQNYRALRDVTLGLTKFDASDDARPLPRLMAVIGANGVGKSSLLDALAFVGQCLEDGVEAACDAPHRGGFERLRTAEVIEPIQFEVRYRHSEKSRPISYTLHINADKSGRPQVVYERLRQRRLGQPHGQPYSFLELKDGKGFAWAGEQTAKVEGREKVAIKMSDRQRPGVSTLGALAAHPRIGQFREFLSGWYLSYFVPELARAQPTAGVEPHLNRRGDNLAKYLQFIERQQPDQFEALLKSIAGRIPGLQRIESEVTKDRRLMLLFYSKGYNRPFFGQDMSDGTLKLLAYMLLMEDPEPAPLIGIEEPENGLHHQLLGTLARELSDFASKKAGPQVLVTTHSSHLVDALSPNQVWVLSKGEKGESELIRAADIPGVEALYQEGIPLGSLWYSSHLQAANP
jgi:predicted ATPase